MAGVSQGKMQATPTKVKSLVLDAGPLLSLTPLRGLAERFLTVPQILDELKDKRAKEHFDRLALTAGVQIEVRKPDTSALIKVTEFAKKTGDYAVLSHADLCVLALAYAVDMEAKVQDHQRTEPMPPSDLSPYKQTADKPGDGSSRNDALQSLAHNLHSTHIGTPNDPAALATLDETGAEDPVPSPQSACIDTPSDPAVLATPETREAEVPESSNDYLSSNSDREPTSTQLFDDPSYEEDDGEGEWITPSNVELHKSRALELLPGEEVPKRTRRGKGRFGRSADEPESLASGCMTADFAMQNVLLQMGLNLIGVEGKRIERVKTWVLRCHACFKICKDPAKKFCPSCGNPTLLRTSVTISSTTTSPDAEPKLQVHLKRNFQWKNRGTKYSIPAPKPGSSKTGAGEGLILREDQTEWVRAEKRAEGRRQKEERKMISAISNSSGPSGVKLDWMDPDWLPEMLVVGAGGKGRSSGKGDMPPVGYGRKNPNERKRRKR